MTMTAKLDESAKGVYVIAATPFADDGALDLTSTERMIDFYLSCGVQGMTILGMMGESTKLSEAESQTVIRCILKRVAGRIPVVVGVSNPGLAAMAELTRFSMGEGAAGVMVSTTSNWSAIPWETRCPSSCRTIRRRQPCIFPCRCLKVLSTGFRKSSFSSMRIALA
jgi:hypothetical protein